ncbi:hypothetical protein [Sorangium sp. So ce233]|uniref:hypothetical protein n=1 Tax=Sorangium sp. So ce233 TaxID=3133290 RepID=UPI003F628DBA
MSIFIMASPCRRSLHRVELTREHPAQLLDAPVARADCSAPRHAVMGDILGSAGGPVNARSSQAAFYPCKMTSDALASPSHSPAAPRIRSFGSTLTEIRASVVANASLFSKAPVNIAAQADIVGFAHSAGGIQKDARADVIGGTVANTPRRGSSSRAT